MFKARNNGRNNIVGVEVRRRRKEQKISQRELSDRLADIGLDVDKNAIQRLEHGDRFVTDIELVFLAKYFECSVEELILVKKEERNKCR